MVTVALCPADAVTKRRSGNKKSKSPRFKGSEESIRHPRVELTPRKKQKVKEDFEFQFFPPPSTPPPVHRSKSQKTKSKRRSPKSKRPDDSRSDPKDVSSPPKSPLTSETPRSPNLHERAEKKEFKPPREGTGTPKIVDDSATTERKKKSSSKGSKKERRKTKSFKSSQHEEPNPRRRRDGPTSLSDRVSSPLATPRQEPRKSKPSKKDKRTSPRVLNFYDPSLFGSMSKGGLKVIKLPKEDEESEARRPLDFLFISESSACFSQIPSMTRSALKKPSNQRSH